LPAQSSTNPEWAIRAAATGRIACAGFNLPKLQHGSTNAMSSVPGRCNFRYALSTFFAVVLASGHAWPNTPAAEREKTMPNSTLSPSGDLVSSGAAAPARDGDIAIVEEFEAAVSSNSVEALELFIARHPGHRLVPAARDEIDRLTRPNGK